MTRDGGSNDLRRVVVVGASLAGLRACETLRQEGFTGTITLVGDEAHQPYDRPPLSKALLAGELESDRIALRRPDAVTGLDLEMLLGRRAVSLDTAQRSVGLADGSTVTYDALVIATGARPRRLPDQPDIDGVVTLRTLDDAQRLRQHLLAPGARLVIIGAGFIGLEVASTALDLGCRVTVVEGAPAPLLRGLGDQMGPAVADIARRRGVDLRCATPIAAVEHDHGRVRGVRLADGSLLEADVVLVGVGATPNVEWLDGSGLTVADGLVCDAALHTGADDVYAAGDCVRWPNGVFRGHDDEVMRIEHWTNASEQGAVAARNLLAVARGELPVPFESVPFFWSEQFGRRIQFVGRAHGGDEIAVVAGEPTGAVTVLYGWQGRLRGALGVDMPKLVIRFRQMVADRATWDDALTRAAELTS